MYFILWQIRMKNFTKIFSPIPMSVQLKEKESIPVSFQAIESIKVMPSTSSPKILLASRDASAYIVELSTDLINSLSKVIKAYDDVHTKRVTDACYSVEGDKVITVSADNRIVVWDRETKKTLVFHGHSRAITSVAINAKNNKIVTASEDGSFILWNTLGEKIAVFDKSIEHAHKSWINACGFVPNSNDIFMTAGDDGTVKMWDLESLKLLKTFSNAAFVDYEKAKEAKIPVKDCDFDLAVKAVAFSKDGSLLAFGGRNCKVYLLNLIEGEFLQTIEVSDKVIALAYGETQPFIAISIPNKILLWNIIDNKMAGEYVFATKGENYCRSLTFVGDEIVAAFDNGKISRIELTRN